MTMFGDGKGPDLGALPLAPERKTVDEIRLRKAQGRAQGIRDIYADVAAEIAGEKRFRMRYADNDGPREIEFSEADAPGWLTGENTDLGSEGDVRWFWKGHVLKLEPGEAVGTALLFVTRIA